MGEGQGAGDEGHRGGQGQGAGVFSVPGEG